MARTLIIEADGGARGNPGPAAYGALVRDGETGELLFEEGTAIGVETNNVAEYEGLVAGLRAAHELDPDSRVEARLDSKLIVEQMSGRWKIKHENMRRLALAARDIFPAGRVRYTWVPRAQNTEADRLVNQALDGSPIRRWHTQRGGADEPTDAEPERAGNVLVGWSKTHPTVTTMTLLRHGATVHSVAKRFSGWGGDDPGLSDEGRQQAAQVAAHLSALGEPDLIVASPMARTVETARIAADQLHREVLVDHDLRECAFGEWDGKTFAEVQEQSPDELAKWLAATDVAPPGGESFDEVTDRVTAVRDRLVAEHPGRSLLLVTHVTPLKTLVRLALQAPAHAVFRMEVRPGSLSRVQWFGDGHASVASFNETGHLTPTR